ncbi:Rieske 2Fe-2S domain-containing protein [Alphaproteobacteria bacterium]|nr:Rieske 2Fe-2S domain-containing protein [Alphaproteobacteria bacterium]
MVDTEQSWRPVAVAGDVLVDTPLEVAVGNVVFILVRSAGDIIVYQGVCPHAAARLGKGRIVDGWLRCPHHMATFQMSDGVCGKGWALPALRRYAHKIEDGTVYMVDPPVEVEDDGRPS